MNYNVDPIEEQKKAEFLEHLYQQSGRDNLPRNHPHHSTFSGLWQEFMKQNAEQARNSWWAAKNG